MKGWKGRQAGGLCRVAGLGWLRSSVGRAGAGPAGGVTVEAGKRPPLPPGAEFLERVIPPRCCCTAGAGNASRLFCDLSL